MTITTMYNASEANRLTKSLTTLATLNVRLLSAETEIIDPVFELSGAPPSNCNYLQVQAWNRYYFVTGLTQLENGLYRLTAHVDILSSARDKGLTACSGIVARNEYDYNGYLEDEYVKAYQNPYVVQKAFPRGFRQDGVDYVMIIAGG